MEKTKKIILGSASPRRKQLLAGLFPAFEVRVMDTKEDFPANLREEQVALFLAEQKAKAFVLNKDELLITADTIVWLDETVLNKPADRKEAIDMLKALSGRMHKVFTGICLLSGDKKKLFSVESDVYFRKLEESEIELYVDGYKPYDKAGSYGAQECLPDKFNPLSETEKAFLKEIGNSDLFEKSLSVMDKKHVNFIERIEGSYFNVMGLPVAEVYHEVIRMSNHG